MIGIEIEWGEAFSVMVKVAALWVLWQCGRGIKNVCEKQVSSDLGQLVDCLGKLKEMAITDQTTGAPARKTPG